MGRWPAEQRRVVWVEPSGRACPGRQRTRHPDTAEHRTVDSVGGNGGPQPENIDFLYSFLTGNALFRQIIE
jgi:hypothetical protein